MCSWCTLNKILNENLIKDENITRINAIDNKKGKITLIATLNDMSTKMQSCRKEKTS